MAELFNSILTLLLVGTITFVIGLYIGAKAGARKVLELFPRDIVLKYTRGKF